MLELRSFSEHRNLIQEVLPNSIAEELGLEPGDEILTINGNKIKDIIDYKFHMYDENILLKILKKDGSLWEFDIEKEFQEDLGIDFTNPLIDKAKSCSNHCIFCFIDQLPQGMRQTLYFKDDDSRLSFLQGNFITLTNLKDEDIQRIIDYRIAPINISIHTTNPKLRQKILHNPRAGKILPYLKRFQEANIEVQGQIVLMPQINDGVELDHTLDDLIDLYPSMTSVAIVPIGLTKYRKRLAKLKTFDQITAKAVIDQVKKYQDQCLKQYGTKLIFLSDEFYITAKEDIPPEEHYEGYPQIENGVGMVRSFWEEFKEALPNLQLNTKKNIKVLLGTGHLAAPLMNRIGQYLNKAIPSVDFETVEIKNEFFGESITVSGLLTGRDVIAQLKDKPSDVIMLPKNMMRNYDPITLDDLKVEDLENALSRPIYFGPWNGQQFIDTIRQVLGDV
ncbi:MAG: DUF512 domain-containing protein [Tissierellia bacterium]|nr:DUF512 domain-containing protein [Tissierellia bacterium]